MGLAVPNEPADGWLAWTRTSSRGVTMNGSLRAQCIAEFLGTGLFLFFGIC
ncbi:TPA: aquaporin, partial [Klebsiella pneumoniae]|nr:aquaporin [Klebsiella pneumoniae]